MAGNSISFIYRIQTPVSEKAEAPALLRIPESVWSRKRDGGKVGKCQTLVALEETSVAFLAAAVGRMREPVDKAHELLAPDDDEDAQSDGESELDDVGKQDMKPPHSL